MPAARDNEAGTTAALAGKDADSISEAISNMPAEQIPADLRSSVDLATPNGGQVRHP